MVTVSVVIPTYNRPQLLKRCIESVLSQSLRDIEVIIVNAHPDSIVSKDSFDDDRVKCINLNHDPGISGTRNTGIRRSSGKYIAFVDDDDSWKHDKLEKQVELIERTDNEIGLIYCGRDIVRNGNVMTEYPKARGDVTDILLRKNIIPSETPLLKKEVLEEVGYFDTDFSFAEDRDLWIRVSEKYEVDYVDSSLAIYDNRSKGSRLSSNFWSRAVNHMGLIRKHWGKYRKSTYPLLIMLLIIGIEVVAASTNNIKSKLA